LKASPEVARIAEDDGDQRARASSDWGDWELPSVCCLSEEEEGIEAELLAVVAWRGAAQNGGERWRPELGFRRPRAERRGGEEWRS
jgi:hypothetical protein